MSFTVSALRLTFLAGLFLLAPLPEASAGGADLALPDSLPLVFENDKTDLLRGQMRHEALLKSRKHQLPSGPAEWKTWKKQIREQVITNAGVKFFPALPPDVREKRVLKREGYTIRMIYFQTRPGVYATANLYVPDGPGPFPGVVVMMGHSNNGKLYENYQSVGHALALDGYVALAVDPWGAGERTPVAGEHEYHGSNIGASLLTVGETLLGMQLTDNIRAVDVLRTLPYVDREKIGATGASGGGNQTMWLAAIDERVKAAMPVVSVGTFESYIMAHNCVCEALPSGLEFTEEWGILGLVAPRAIKMCNHHQESNPTFFPAEMMKSYEKAREIFALEGVRDHISYEFFQRPHGYYSEDREALLGWLDFHLKGTGNGKARKEKAFELVPPEDLTVFPGNDRDPLVQSTEAFCRMTGAALRQGYLSAALTDKKQKKEELAGILKVGSPTAPVKVYDYGKKGIWERRALETKEGLLIPVLHKLPGKGKTREYALIVHPEGKASVSPELIDRLTKEGKGIVMADLSGTGEARSYGSDSFDKLGRLHTYSRAQWWLGRTVLGAWVNELDGIVAWLNKDYKALSVELYGYKEAALAGLFMSALRSNIKSVHLYNAPLSYLFDSHKEIGFLGLGVYVPGMLQWGDISLAAALSPGPVYVKDPVTMSGRSLTADEILLYKKEFEGVRKKTSQPGNAYF